MKNFRGLLKRLCYGGIDAADYHAASKAINEHNSTMAYKLSALFTTVFVVLVVVSLAIPSYRNGFQIYTMFAVVYTLITAEVKMKSRENNSCNRTMVFVSLALFFFAIILNKFVLFHDAESIFLLIYILMISVCFIVPTCTILTYQIIVFAVYIACDYLTKQPANNIMLDGVKGTFGIIIGTVIGQALLKGQMAGLNDLNRDGLTRIYNRRKIDSYLTEVVNDAAGFAVAMLDIDHFKHFNDTYGHSNGDEVLIAVARELEKTAQEHDAFVGRYGGEEFLFIVHGEDSGSIVAGICEEARKRVASLEIVPNGCDFVVPVTISGGYADRDEVNGDYADRDEVNAEIAADIVRAADDALYWSKNHGRDRITAAHAKIKKIQRFVNGA